ncbi:KRCL protein, partial [Thryothorus ludovicianus]|nr:KRCL protein [Thryothorus ludovicianus]
MSPFHDLCLPAGLACPEPFAVTRSDTCVIRYPDTVVDIVEPDFPPYSLIFPGPTLTTFPQQSLVGSTALPELRELLGPRAFPALRGRCAPARGGPTWGDFWGSGCWNPPFPPHSPPPFCCGTCRPT